VTFSLDHNSKVTIDIPTGWASAKNLLGSPLTIWSEFVDQERVVVAIIPLKDVITFPSGDYFTLELDYEIEKLSWLQQVSGKLIKFAPATMVKLNSGLSALTLGHTYYVNNKTYNEKNYYLNCKQHGYIIKLLASHNLSNQQTMAETLIGGMSCL